MSTLDSRSTVLDQSAALDRRCVHCGGSGLILRRGVLWCPTHCPPLDCTCDGFHTDHVDVSIDDARLRILIDMEECPAERRALIRCLTARS